VTRRCVSQLAARLLPAQLMDWQVNRVFVTGVSFVVF
jgi:hypothetical protein